MPEETMLAAIAEIPLADGRDSGRLSARYRQMALAAAAETAQQLGAGVAIGRETVFHLHGADRLARRSADHAIDLADIQPEFGPALLYLLGLGQAEAFGRRIA